MIATKKSGFVKWLMPAKQKNAETSRSTIRWDVVGGRNSIDI
jgi:hypothetical protein